MKLQALALRHGDHEQGAYLALVEEIELQASECQPEALLGPHELAQFRALRFPRKRQSFVLGRVAAKRALGALLTEPDLQCIEIRSGVFGQPLIHHPRAGSAQVTLSHSHGLAVALAYPDEIPMGVDLETVSASSAVTILSELQTSDAEKAWLAARMTNAATACGIFWSAREALGKSMKIGLNCPLGILALDYIESFGSTTWIGSYANFPQSRCLSQEIQGRVLSIAMPAPVILAPWPLMTI